MPPPILLTVGNKTFRSDEPPENIMADCETLLCAFARREIPDLTILREWHRQMPGWAGLLGHGDADAVGKWAFDQFYETGIRRDRPRLHLLISARLHQVGLLSNGRSVFSLLAITAWTEGIADFVRMGGDVGINLPNFWSCLTGLNHFIISGPIELVPVLLAHGADPNLKDVTGMTALHHAVSAGCDDVETVKVLVAAGADLRAVTQHGHTALELARKTKDKRVIQFLSGLMEAAA